MNGYCKLCNLRIEGPRGPADLSQTADERARDEVVGLGLLTLHHLAKEHAGQLAGLFSTVASVEAVIACHCLAPAPVAAFLFEAERERLKAEVVAWLNQAELVQLTKSAPAAV